MDSATHTSYFADDRSYFSILKKDIHKKASDAGFCDRKLAELDIVVAEITSNLFKYAVRGEILVCVAGGKGKEYIELLSIDSGPGMTDANRMVGDGVSSSGTLGEGLGSIRRLSDFFELYSIRGWGTILLCRIYKNSVDLPVKEQVIIRSLTVPKPGETVSGDGNCYKITADYFKVLVADGLGHGIEANKAVVEAGAAFKLCPYHDPAQIIRFIHDSIRKTRGAVGTVVVFDFKERKWSIAGVGNISSRMISYLDGRNFMSYNGIIGHNIPNTIKSHEVSANDFQQIILCSDGLKSRWDTGKYPNINKYDPSVLAAALYKDFGRRTDDMSVVISKVF
ncbi:SpoIIE family protein phosphatase [Desertivirga xinjiangensis]|uniref:SpoIIE family protein phosphatase n=1 Tax=Desertivirga xinjiangensis TaxID=539206 RepID=UPI00210BBEC4|nr:SpoIIE family protein phosphatase [Pedobacter xinjiangensis]